MSNQDNNQTNKKRFSKWKLLGALAFTIPIILGVFFMYEMSLKQVLIVTSESPNQSHKIEILELGEPVNYSASAIKIKSDKDVFEIGLKNYGELITAENFKIVWLNDDEAQITLIGSRQEPEAVDFNAQNETVFSTGLVDLEDIAYVVGTSRSPNGLNEIEIQQISEWIDNGWKLQTSVVYSEKGDESGSFVVGTDELYVVDEYVIKWESDTSAEIEFLKRNTEGKLELQGSLHVAFD